MKILKIKKRVGMEKLKCQKMNKSFDKVNRPYVIEQLRVCLLLKCIHKFLALHLYSLDLKIGITVYHINN